MKTVLRLGLLCGMLWACLARTSTASDRPAVEPITVRTASGRSFCGQLDPATDSACLQLRSAHGTSSILRPIRWDRVVQIELDGNSYGGEEFLAAFEAVRSTLPPRPSPLPPTTVRLVGAAEETRSPVASMNAFRPPVALSSPPVRVCWLQVDACVANWDRDAEVDGILVEVRPLDDRGLLVPVDGTLTVDLYGQRNTPVNHPEPAIRLGHWSRRVAAEQFSLHGAACRFAFQAANPAISLDIAPDGLVVVRLSVPGQGVLEANACLPRLRPYCSIWDEAFRATQSR